MSILDKERQLIEDFNYFSSWEEKYEYLIDLGKNLPDFPEEYRQEMYLIEGCQSKVWLFACTKEGRVIFYADADAVIVKGLIALFVHLLSNEPASAIEVFSFDFLEKIGLSAHLSPTRSNGLRAMARQIRAYAQALASVNTPSPMFNVSPLTSAAKKTLEEEIIAVLRTIFDPEIPVDIYALGLIYQITIDDAANVLLHMTLTSPNCPVAESLPQEVKNKIQSLPNVHTCEIKIVFDPAWHKDMMSQEAKLELGFL